MNRFKSIGSIVYGVDKKEQPCVYIPDKPFNKTIMRIGDYTETKSDFQLNVYGKIIDFRLFTGYHCLYPVASFHPSQKECVINSIHNYFLDFFGNYVEYHWRVENFEAVEYYIPTIPQLKNVSFGISMYLNVLFADMKNLEKFFSSSPVLKSIKINPKKTTEPFNPDSKFYQIESIEIQQLRHTFPALLSHFQGKQAFIKCGLCEISDLIAFVNKWKSGEAFQNLEYLTMRIVCDRVSRTKILNGIGPKYIDDAKQPPTHSVPKL
ncbi:unnamed protein product [Caenorhabditis nigoni]